jgi:hypothetical protein
MPNPIDLDVVLKKQPQLDPEELKVARERRERLRNRPRQYQLVPPFGGRRVRTIDPSTLNPFRPNPDPLPDRGRNNKS